MSFLGFNIAGTALDTFQQAENVTAQNIANVQTPGASRQIVNIGQLPPIDGNTMFPNGLQPGTQGTGVFIQSITRVHQDSYDALFRGATASQNFFSSQQSVLTGLQSSFGEPKNGINAAFSTFQTAVQTLANNPQGNAERTGLLTSAKALVVSLNTAGTAVQSSEVQTQNQATSLITTINSTIDQIAALNGQIRAAKAVGDNPNTYQDQRDQLVDTLSTYVNTETSVQADGSTLVTVNGLALVNDTVAYHLASPVIGTNANGTPALQVDFVVPPNPVNPPAINITGGQLGGLLDTYNNKLLPYGTKLDDFANALATESDRISQAGYDLTGQPGSQLFAPVVTQLPISAGNIQVGISTPNEVPAASASTANGVLVQALNAANSTVDTTVPLDKNQSFANPTALAAGASLNGTITINVDGINPLGVPPGIKVNYQVNSSTGAPPAVPAGTIDATTIDSFINGFNGGHYGVTASFDVTSQKIVFARDPTNIDLVHRAEMQSAVPPGTTTPSFTLTDSNLVGAPAQPPLGTAATSLFTALGANLINGVNQNGLNAFGSTSGGNVSALQSLFSGSFGTPALQTSVAIPAGGYAAGSSITITGPVGPPPPFATLNVGDALTIYDGVPATLANSENVTISAVNRNTNTITFTVAKTHPAAATTLYIASAQSSTLQQSYANLVAKMGLDTATATTGNASQTTLASNVNQVRQSTNGINIDEETQNLVKFQNAYGAAAHVISILSAMLTTAINLGQ
jgi:flagellar hook-associated protein 1 FlgK